MSRIRVRVALSPLDAARRIGTAFAGRGADGETHNGVRIEHAGVIYDVVPSRDEHGVLSLVYCAETAVRGWLPEHGLSRKRLAHLASAFLASEVDISIASEPVHPRGRLRPADDELVRIVRDALSDGDSPRQVLRAVFGVELATADDWIKHARGLPGSGIPKPRGNRGRPPRRARDDTQTPPVSTGENRGESPTNRKAER